MTLINELVDGAEAYSGILEHVIRERARAKDLQDQAKNIIEDVNKIFMDIHKLCGVDKVNSELGSVFVMSTGGRETFNKDKAKDLLIKKGVDSSLVAEAFKKATSKGKEGQSVSFRAAGDKE